MDLLLIYFWPILASSVFSTFLGIQGCQLAARRQILHVFCVAQAALLGSLIYLSMGTIFHLEHHQTLLGSLIAVVFGVLFSVLVESLAKRSKSERSNLLICIFIVLIALNACVTAIVPALESHMSQMFFGDLATLSDSSAYIILVVGCLGAFVSYRLRRQSAQTTFKQVALQQFGGSNRCKSRFWIYALSISLSVNVLGFLFTVAMLFVPTTFLVLRARVGLRQHYLAVMLACFFSTILGFSFSLSFSKFPTVPATVLILIILSGLGWLMSVSRRSPF